MCWFCHTLTWICHECTRVSHPELPSHLPPHPIPLGHYFKPTFSLSCFTFIKRLFSSSSLSAIRVVASGWWHLHIRGYWYFSWQSWFQFVLHHDQLFSWCICIQVKQAGWQYTALTYSFPDLEPVCCSMSSSTCCFLTCIQISQEAGQVVWCSCFSKNFPQFVVIHTVKGFGIVNKTKVDVFLEIACFFYDPTDVGNLISGSSVFSKSNLNIWEFTVHVLLKIGLENFELYFASVWNKCNCAVVWAFFGIAFLWDWNENWPLPVMWSLLSFPNVLA